MQLVSATVEVTGKLQLLVIMVGRVMTGRKGS